MWICDNRRVLPGFGADLYGFYRDPAEWREGGRWGGRRGAAGGEGAHI